MVEQVEEKDDTVEGRYTKTFTGVKEGELYTIALLTVINGKVVSELRKHVLAVSAE